MREIDITKQDIRCCDDFEICDDGSVQIPYELWFDVDKYFGTNTKDSDSWVNFYTVLYPDGTVKASYTVDTDYSFDDYDWDLTETEQEFFKEKMESYCKLRCGCSIAEMVKEVMNNEN